MPPAQSVLQDFWEWMSVKVNPGISTTEATFQSHLPDTTIFQTNSFDLLSEFALLVSYTTCSAYSSALLRESEKMSQQNKRKILFHLNKFFMIRIFFEQNHFSADCVARPAQRDQVHKFCVTIKKGLVVLNATDRPFSFMLAPGLTALD